MSMKQMLFFGIFATTIVSALSWTLSRIGRNHLNAPIAGGFAAYKERENYYKKEDAQSIPIDEVKECIRYMDELYLKLKNVKTHEAIRILEEGIEFFKKKGATVAVEKLTKLRDDLK